MSLRTAQRPPRADLSGTAQARADYTMPLPWTTSQATLALQAEKTGRASQNLATSPSSRLRQHATVRSRVIRFDATGSRTSMTAEERAWYQRFLAQDAPRAKELAMQPS
ncbi:hypothetical protein ACFYWD_36035 [Streptomyces sp. NPDC003781]|uniref:hypothetical protein n=1 Tax=Streptomyces sp. NPDC003781 TaxID=3364686 RepID=UPI0036BB6191